MFHLLEAAGIIVSCALATAKNAPSASSDFPYSSLLLVVIGGFIAAGASFLVSFFSNRQQLKRDQQAHEQQLERERIAYARSVKDAKRERLHNSYKVILNAAEEYESAIHQFSYVVQSETVETRNDRLDATLRKALAGVNEAMIEITLEDVGTDVRTIYAELQQAFKSHALMQDSNTQFPGSFSQDQLDKNKNTVVEKLKELIDAMQKHLKELES